ncbi:MAG: TIGR03960 family B12-binding radical SAM protein, partial [bacterium]
EKPDRYTGSEIGLAELPSKPILRIAIAFPDLYELGMSYLGLRILYHLATRLEGVACERVFMPWFDAENRLRHINLPLFTLETRTPLRELDLLGVTMQYELHATNLLAMLELGGIPRRAAQRSEDDPIVLAGGPLSFHPESIASFFDAVAVGDGETIWVEVIELLKEEKRKKSPRRRIVRALGDLSGIYLPGYYQARYSSSGEFCGLKKTDPMLPDRISSRITPQLLPGVYPQRPIVPNLTTTHNRLTLEIARGCSRGCRFCGPGIIYRPVREKPVHQIVQEALAGLEATGYSQVSLLSLSTADYSALPELLEALQPILTAKQASLSFPSLRPDLFTPQMADLAAGLSHTSEDTVSRTGLTFAPEAATPRLRAVINKDTSAEALLTAAELAFERGWNTLKLYYMIGLPTETDEDLRALVDSIREVANLGRRFGGRTINVSLSPFTPKPHSPFEREPLLPMEELRRRIAMIKVALRKYHSVRLDVRDPEISWVEAVIARGDRRVADAIEQRYLGGGRFDAWSDGFSAARWREAFAQTNVNLEQMTGCWERIAYLPWDHIDYGVHPSFLQAEMESAHRLEFTSDCREDICHFCGFHERSELPCPEIIKPELRRDLLPRTGVSCDEPYQRYRLIYQRSSAVRYISHLNALGVLERALRRLGVPLEFTKGLKPHVRLVSSPPLAVGFCSTAEYLDFGITGQWSEELTRRLQAALPKGFAVKAVMPCSPDQPSLGELNRFLYQAQPGAGSGGVTYSERIKEMLDAATLPVLHRGKQGARELDAKPQLWRLAMDAQTIIIGLDAVGGPMPKVSEILTLVTGFPYEHLLADWIIERTGMWWLREGAQISPI